MTKLLLSVLATCAALALAGFLIWYIVFQPGQARQAARQGQVDATYSQADARASNAATGAVASLGERNQARDDLTRGTSDAVNALPGAALPFDPELDAAAQRRFCLRDAYRATPACAGVH